MQFIIIAKNAINVVLLESKNRSNFTGPLFIFSKIRDNPKPIRKLKTGPDIEPESASLA